MANCKPFYGKRREREAGTGGSAGINECGDGSWAATSPPSLLVVHTSKECENTEGKAAVFYIFYKQRSYEIPQTKLFKIHARLHTVTATEEPGNHKLDFHSTFATHNHAFWFSTLPHSHPQPITPHAMPSSPNAGCHLNSDHKRNS